MIILLLIINIVAIFIKTNLNFIEIIDIIIIIENSDMCVRTALKLIGIISTVVIVIAKELELDAGSVWASELIDLTRCLGWRQRAATEEHVVDGDDAGVAEVG